MTDTSKDIELLRAAVERKLGQKLHTPRDFELLRDAVFQECHELVSLSTLKRIWGYVQTDSTPRVSSLTPLARFVGCTNWDDFIETYGVPSGKPACSVARRLSIAAVAVLLVASAWAVFRVAVRPVPSSQQAALVAPSGQRVLHGGSDRFSSIQEYLSLFGIGKCDTPHFQPLPGHRQVFVWGPEYGHPVWHNEGDKQQLMPTITEYWTPRPDGNADNSAKYVKEVNAKLYYERLCKDELRITFMKNLTDSSYVFLGIYRMDCSRSTTERFVWKRVASDCDLGQLGLLERLRTKE